MDLEVHVYRLVGSIHVCSQSTPLFETSVSSVDGRFDLALPMFLASSRGH